MKKIVLLVMFLFSSLVYAEKSLDLKLLYEADQSERTGNNIDFGKLFENDRKRRVEVTRIIKEQGLHTSSDYFHAAMIFQHGETIEDYKMAFSLAWMSTFLDPENKTAKWLTAATWDRIHTSKGLPQWYGTQFFKEAMDSPWVLEKVHESAVTDDERIELGVPTLEQSMEKVREMNAP